MFIDPSGRLQVRITDGQLVALPLMSNSIVIVGGSPFDDDDRIAQR